MVNLVATDESRRVILAGGAGFLGRALARTLAQDGREVVILSRRPAPDDGLIRTVVWDGRTVGEWAEELNGADAVVNLTGRSVACLYTPENKREIISSRVDSVRAIAQACDQCHEPPPVLVQASSLAIYGDAGERICDETAPHGTGFSVHVCEAWEKAFFAGAAGGTRRAALRIGFVLGRNGGALGQLAKLARWFVGGAAGSGRQYISWLHIDDFCAMVRWAIENPEAEGVYNATGSAPVTNAEFMRALRSALGRPWSPPTPAWAVVLGAHFIMRADPSLALTGRRCVPRRFLDEGFVLQHTDLNATLRGLLAPQKNV
jgi:uncharacterized protein (TIGR01777 family)